MSSIQKYLSRNYKCTNTKVMIIFSEEHVPILQTLLAGIAVSSLFHDARSLAEIVDTLSSTIAQKVCFVSVVSGTACYSVTDFTEYTYRNWEEAFPGICIDINDLL